MCVYAATVGCLKIYRSLCGKFFRISLRSHFFKYVIFEIIILIEFGLTDLAETPVHHLSLGQKKRVSIADVMVLQPQLLVLDEPTAYLDIRHTRNLIKTLKKIHQNGNTLLMATHDLDLVYRWADWVFVMDKGQLILEGKPEDVFSQRTLLEELELGVPLIYEMLFSGLSAEEGIIMERVRQRILKDG